MKIRKSDEMETSIKLHAYKWAMIIGWIVAVFYFTFGAFFGILHLELAFVPFVQTAVYWIIKLIKTEKMIEGGGDEE